jgi:RNA polymerase sigma factor (sigma-70 family)
MQTEEEYSRIWNAHQGIAVRMARYYAGAETEPSDLVQEIAIQVWRALPGFRGEAQLSTWFYRVALNTCLSHRRRKKNDTLPLTALPEKAIDEAARIDQQSLLREIFRVAETFKPADKSLLLLLLEDLSYEEMAAITGMSVNHVGVRINRIRNKLKSIFSDGN